MNNNNQANIDAFKIIDASTLSFSEKMQVRSILLEGNNAKLITLVPINERDAALKHLIKKNLQAGRDMGLFSRDLHSPYSDLEWDYGYWPTLQLMEIKTSSNQQQPNVASQSLISQMLLSFQSFFLCGRRRCHKKVS